MFSKIPTELRKLEYPIKPHQLLSKDHRNVTYIPISQVRQPLNKTDPPREVPIHQTVLQRPNSNKIVTFPPGLRVFTENAVPSDKLTSIFPRTSKLENDIHTIEEKKIVKPIQQIDHELKIKNVEEIHQEVNSYEEKSNRRFPIFDTKEDSRRKGKRKSAIFRIEQTKSHSRIPIFKSQQTVSKSMTPRHKIFEVSKSPIRLQMTQSKIFNELKNPTNQQKTTPKIERIQKKQPVLLVEKPVISVNALYKPPQPVLPKVQTISQGTNTQSRLIRPVSPIAALPVFSNPTTYTPQPTINAQPFQQAICPSPPALNSLFQAANKTSSINFSIPNTQPMSHFALPHSASFQPPPQTVQPPSAIPPKKPMAQLTAPPSSIPAPPPVFPTAANMPSYQYNPHSSALRYTPPSFVAQPLPSFPQTTPVIPQPKNRRVSPAPKYIPLPPSTTPKSSKKQGQSKKVVHYKVDPIMILMGLLTVISVAWFISEIIRNFG